LQISVSKVLKCAANEDVVTIRAEDEGDIATFVFEGGAGENDDFCWRYATTMPAPVAG
jgi:hypothetical protein